MLATVRLGAIHSVVFGGFAAASLAARIDDAQPKVMVTSDAGMRMGKMIALKPLVDESIRLAKSPPEHVLIVDRGLDKAMTPRRRARRRLRRAAREARGREGAGDLARVERAVVHPLHQRHHRQAQGRAARHRRLRGGARRVDAAHLLLASRARPTSPPRDIGWVVGHSYIVYGPLINGSTTIMYEGVPIRPDAGHLVEDRAGLQGDRRCSRSPTAIRVLKKQDPAWMKKYDTSSLRYLFLAGEPLDEPTARWVSESLGCAGRRQLLADRDRAGRSSPPAPASRTRRASSARPSFPAYGYQREAQARGDRRRRCGAEREGRAVHRAAAAAGRR